MSVARQDPSVTRRVSNSDNYLAQSVQIVVMEFKN